MLPALGACTGLTRVSVRTQDGRTLTASVGSDEIIEDEVKDKTLEGVNTDGSDPDPR
jgi:hypothetical protein